MLKAKQIFLNIFMTIQLKYFHDSLNIVVILDSGREFFSTNFSLRPISFKFCEMKLNEGDFSFGAVIIHF